MESIPKLVETGATSISGDGVHVAIGMGDPEVLLDGGAQQREVAVAE